MEEGPGGRQVQLEDPDGNPIELFEPADEIGVSGSGRATWLSFTGTLRRRTNAAGDRPVNSVQSRQRCAWSK